MKLECIECADVGKVKHDIVEEEVEDKNSVQNKEDGSSGQENLAAMWFVHYITSNITWVTQLHEFICMPAMSVNDSSLLGCHAVLLVSGSCCWKECNAFSFSGQAVQD